MLPHPLQGKTGAATPLDMCQFLLPAAHRHPWHLAGISSQALIHDAYPLEPLIVLDPALQPGTVFSCPYSTPPSATAHLARGTISTCLAPDDKVRHGGSSVAELLSHAVARSAPVPSPLDAQAIVRHLFSVSLPREPPSSWIEEGTSLFANSSSWLIAGPDVPSATSVLLQPALLQPILP